MDEERPPRAANGANSPTLRRAVSRAPVLVVVAGFTLAVALVLLGARLADAPAPPPDLSRPGTASEPRAVNVILRDYVFNPTPLYLVAGETVRFQLINGGMIDHEFVIGDEAVQRAWAEANAHATPPAPFATAPPASAGPSTGGVRVLLRPGEAANATYAVPASGQLQLVCHLPGHVERGMVGRVVVEPPPGR